MPTIIMPIYERPVIAGQMTGAHQLYLRTSGGEPVFNISCSISRQNDNGIWEDVLQDWNINNPVQGLYYVEAVLELGPNYSLGPIQSHNIHWMFRPYFNGPWTQVVRDFDVEALGTVHTEEVSILPPPESNIDWADALALAHWNTRPEHVATSQALTRIIEDLHTPIMPAPTTIDRSVAYARDLGQIHHVSFSFEDPIPSHSVTMRVLKNRDPILPPPVPVSPVLTVWDHLLKDEFDAYNDGPNLELGKNSDADRPSRKSEI